MVQSKKDLEKFGPRDERGQAVSALTDDDLYPAVAEVIKANKWAEDMYVSTRTWDAGRDVDDTFKAYPPARQIATRLKRSWPDIVKIARKQPGMPEHTAALTATRRNVENALLDDRHVSLALNKVAERTGKLSFGQHEYDVQVEGLLADAARNKTLEYWKPLLPSSDQILRITGDSWDLALAIANLPVRDGVQLTDEGQQIADEVQAKRTDSARPPKDTHVKTTKVQHSERGKNQKPPLAGGKPLSTGRPAVPARKHGLDPAHAAAEFARNQGAWPSTAKVLNEWGAHHAIAMRGVSSGCVISDHLQEAAEILLADDVQPPPFDKTISKAKVDLSLPVPDGLPARKTHPHSEPECIDAVARCMKAKKKTSNLTQRNYLDWVGEEVDAGRGPVPYQTTLTAHGGFAAIKTKALAQVRAATKLPTP